MQICWNSVRRKISPRQSRICRKLARKFRQLAPTWAKVFNLYVATLLRDTCLYYTFWYPLTWNNNSTKRSFLKFIQSRVKFTLNLLVPLSFIVLSLISSIGIIIRQNDSSFYRESNSRLNHIFTEDWRVKCISISERLFVSIFKNETAQIYCICREKGIL